MEVHSWRGRAALAEQLARDAGATLLALRREGVEAREKAPGDLVTRADEAAEALVLGGIRAAFPDDPVVAEESDGPEGARARRAAIEAAPIAWCVDPLDGTTNYVRGRFDFAVSIGLLAWGRPVFGVVHAPARRETFVGGTGVPAARVDDASGERTAIAPSSVVDPSRALVGTGYSSDVELNAWTSTRLVRLVHEARDVRRVGGATLELCDVACGRLDAFFQRGLGPWDVAAAWAILMASGARVGALDGGLGSPFEAEVLASNGRLHAAMVERLR